MRRYVLPTTGVMSVAWVLTAAAVVAVCNPAPAMGADRMVLIEEFTDTG